MFSDGILTVSTKQVKEWDLYEKLLNGELNQLDFTISFGLVDYMDYTNDDLNFYEGSQVVFITTE